MRSSFRATEPTKTSPNQGKKLWLRLLGCLLLALACRRQSRNSTNILQPNLQILSVDAERNQIPSSPFSEEKSMNQYPQIWILCGASGSGKTTIGRLFSQYLECDFLEGDRRHSPANIKKMSNGTPLEDEDRRQWLTDIETDLRWSIDRNQEVVITCSALKAEYRKKLMSLGRVQLIYIDVPKEILEERLSARQNHYMSLKMLDSQIALFDLIQPQENIITINVNNTESIENVKRKLISKATERFPNLENLWWER
jgi:gluconokinase